MLQQFSTSSICWHNKKKIEIMGTVQNGLQSSVAAIVVYTFFIIALIWLVDYTDHVTISYG